MRLSKWGLFRSKNFKFSEVFPYATAINISYVGLPNIFMYLICFFFKSFTYFFFALCWTLLPGLQLYTAPRCLDYHPIVTFLLGLFNVASITLCLTMLSVLQLHCTLRSCLLFDALSSSLLFVGQCYQCCNCRLHCAVPCRPTCLNCSL